jgi:predicted  nucleic acid-binding Zn-ribbon protein
MEKKFKELTEKLKDIQIDLSERFEEMSESVVVFSLDQIKLVQDQLKDLESKIKDVKDKKRVKTITISEDIHTKVKKYCVDKNIKMSDFVESVLSESTSK